LNLSIHTALRNPPDKKVVWVLKDWANFGPATAVQVLDDSGIPENPGQLQHTPEFPEQSISFCLLWQF
jgi:hypothetical protein